MNHFDPAAVTKALKDEGLEIDADEDQGIWMMSFEFNARKQPAILSAPGGEPSISGHYFYAVSFISSERLKSSIDELPVDTLRKILKVQAEVLLAKFDYWTIEGKTRYVAVSPCSIVAFDGLKLRRRLESCAELASRIRAALLEHDASTDNREQ